VETRETREQLSALDEVHRRFESEGVEYWVFGGWAVDFHAGTVTRPHDDMDLAIWLHDGPRVARLLHQDGWTHEPEGAEDGSTAFTRRGVRIELAFLQRDAADADPYTPLADGRRAAWAMGAFGHDVLTLAGVRARVIGLAALREEKAGARDDPAVAAKDRLDRATLARLN
jgi:Aminoglycoside-2''-adenylyltransferase